MQIAQFGRGVFMPDLAISLAFKFQQMKKYFLLAVFSLLSAALFAQNLEDINDMMGNKDFKGAKAAIDKYLSQTKNLEKADAWYFKGRVYNAYSYDKQLPLDEAFQLKSDAYDAFKKHLPMDPKEMRMKLENYASFLDLYYGFYDNGINRFNAKNFEGALQSFKKSLEVKDFILEKKYSYGETKLPVLDTALLVNTATSAVQAKKEEEAVRYFRMISDADISGKDYQSVYEYLSDYYSKNGNEKEMNDILTKARKYYPEDDFWDQIALMDAEKKGDENLLMAKYEELIALKPGNYALLYDYSALLYNTIYTGEKKHQNDQALKEKLTANLKEAIKVDKGIDATMLMATHLFSIASEYSSEASMIKGTKPDDVKKKKELNAQANKYMDEFLPYADAYLNYMDALPSLKPAQKANYRNMASNISEVYAVKGNTKKADEYDKKREAKQ